MIDIQKQIDYWRVGAAEDLPVGLGLVREGSIRHGLFFIHLAIEKILKAHVCRHVADLAPRTHNLTRLVELSGVSFSREDVEFIADMNKFNVEGRYPDSYEELPETEELRAIITESERIYTWLRDQL